MRICLLQHEGSMYSGGQGVYVSNLSRELVALGHEVHLISGPPYPDLVDGVQLHKLKNYNYHRLLATGRRFFYGRPPLDAFNVLNIGELVTTRIGMYSVMGAFSIRAYERLRELSKDETFDVVHDNQVLGYGTLLIKAMGVRVVATVHHPLTVDRANRIREATSIGEQIRSVLFYPFFMQQIVIRSVDQVVAVSPTAARSVAKAFGLCIDDVAVVWNGVDTGMFRRKPEVEREKGRILFVGDSEDRNKGFRYLLEAVHLLGPFADVHVVVVQRSWSKQAPLVAQALGLADKVSFLDSLATEELVDEYNRAELLVSPSLYEGFGLPAAEALACRTPVVATNVGAFPALIEDGVAGRIVAPGDAEALADAIRSLLNDDALRTSMGDSGSEWVRERFTWKQTAKEMVDLYAGDPPGSERLEVAS